ncbi:MAG: hypothetical protein LH471_09680 [Salinibacterium sp.]|nr:hypothetical protein [Salinibacterium sp.]
MAISTTTPHGTRRRFSLDPRLLIGLALVAASVAGVVVIVSASDESVLVYAARDALAPGDRVRAPDLQELSVQLQDAHKFYLASDSIPDDGFVVTKPVGAGELIPSSATGSLDGLRVTALVISVNGQLAASVAPGAVVDIWAARETDVSATGSGQASAPASGPPAVVTTATVARLVDSGSFVAGAETTAVEVLVPKSRVARVLQAIANDDQLSIVPTYLTGG